MAEIINPPEFMKKFSEDDTASFMKWMAKITETFEAVENYVYALHLRIKTLESEMATKRYENDGG